MKIILMHKLEVGDLDHNLYHIICNALKFRFFTYYLNKYIPTKIYACDIKKLRWDFRAPRKYNSMFLGTITSNLNLKVLWNNQHNDIAGMPT